MKLLENTKGLHLMIWETNPRMRNKNNVIKLNIDERYSLEVGDCIVGSYGDNDNPNFSGFKIDKIIESRKSSLSGMNYITAKTNWKRFSKTDVEGYNTDKMSDRFCKLFNV